MGIPLKDIIDTNEEEKKGDEKASTGGNELTPTTVRIPDDLKDEVDKYVKETGFSTAEILRSGLRLWLDKMKYDDMNKKYSFEFRMEKIIRDVLSNKLEDLYREIDGLKRELAELTNELVERDTTKYEYQNITTSSLNKILSVGSENRAIDQIIKGDEHGIKTASLSGVVNATEPYEMLQGDYPSDERMEEYEEGSFGTETPLEEETPKPSKSDSGVAIRNAGNYDFRKEEVERERINNAQIESLKNRTAKASTKVKTERYRAGKQLKKKEKTATPTPKPKEETKVEEKGANSKPIIYYDPSQDPPFVAGASIEKLTSRYAIYSDKSVYDRKLKKWLTKGAVVGKVLKMEKVI